MSFHVGQKVVCIQDHCRPEHARWSTTPVGKKCRKITVGCVYTIRDIDYRALDLHGVATLRFEGIAGRKHPSIVGPWESGYPANYFRPVIERKTDISIFTDMLTPKHQQKPV